MKSRVAPLSNWTTANGPYDVGLARPSTPATSRAAVQVSFAWTRVWLKSTVMMFLRSSGGSRSSRAQEGDHESRSRDQGDGGAAGRGGEAVHQGRGRRPHEVAGR